MIRRSKQPAPVQAGPDEPAAEVTESQSAPAGFAAQAEQHQHEAERASERAAQGRADAQAVIDKAERDAAQRTAAARAKALAITAEATAAEREAVELVARAQQEASAAQLEDQADDADQKVSDLSAERGQLLERAAELDASLARVEAEQQDLDGQLGRARDTGDLDALTAAIGRIDAAQLLATDLKGKRAAVQSRLEVLGDGAVSGELADAREAASEAHKAVRRIRNELDPSREEAIHDRVLDEVQAALAGNIKRLTAEAAAAKPQHTVIL